MLYTSQVAHRQKTTMKIGASLNSLPIDRKRESGRDVEQAGGPSGRPAAAGISAGQVETSLDPAALQKFVDVLKNMEPQDLHRVEDLRRQIADGSYGADADAMIDDLMSFLDDGRLEA
ncbi:MAG: flagellar biosynthesis anti-sigma factor FlgM [Planctomycetota bacterium]|nr:MAG: flagellar biosynthesis anti-sigma factor FlgM [Planctomycetota bacterium]